MRLLNVKSGALEEFSAATIPKYAILSHTWGDDEVTFLDLYQHQNAGALPFKLPFATSTSPETKPSYNKIRHARRQAESDGLEFLWADTCCIDKSSSAELSEAINSMFRYYSQAAICYAYLQDAPDGFPHKQVEDAVDDLTDLTGRRFVSCRWFSRGWTLQELIAPRKVHFYGGWNWRYLGTKETLSDWIVLATGIDKETLLDASQLRRISIARRMSWAANRNSTRVEDIAYCLLGIFGVNMPLLYGEGENAFIRLQEEIMKFSDDQSLFAWRARPEGQKSAAFGIFARSPKQFEDSSTIVPLNSGRPTSPFIMTNRGLQIDLPLLPLESEYLEEAGDKEYLGILDCQYEDDFSTCLAITLKQTQTHRVFIRLEGEDSSLIRVTPQMASKAIAQTLFIPRHYELMTRAYMNCQVQCGSLKDFGYSLVKVLRPKSNSKSRWNPETQVMRIEAADDYSSQEFLPHATFIFRNRAVGSGFAIRLDLKNVDGVVRTRISRLRQQAHDYAFFHQDVLASYLNASKGFAGSVSLLSGSLPDKPPRGPSRAQSTRSGVSAVLAPPSRSKRPATEFTWVKGSPEDLLQGRSTADSSESDLSMSASMLSIEESRPGASRLASSRSNTDLSMSRVSNPGSRSDASGSTVLSRYDIKKQSLHESTDDDDDRDDAEKIEELLSTRKDVLESYCETFQPTHATKQSRQVVLRLPKDKIWKSWTVQESQFKKMLAAFSDDWNKILERDAEKSDLKTYSAHYTSLDDGSQQRLEVSASVKRQDVFGQKLHVLTVAMDMVTAFEVAGDYYQDP